jgi:predicted aspartyl protease
LTVVFDATGPLIVLDAEATGPVRMERVNLILDTGATQSVFRPQILRHLGYTIPIGGISVTAATGSVSAPDIVLDRLVTLERDEIDFPVLALDLPWSVPAEGLLGLDFLRGRVLTIDFRQGHIELN